MDRSDYDTKPRARTTRLSGMQIDLDRLARVLCVSPSDLAYAARELKRADRRRRR